MQPSFERRRAAAAATCAPLLLFAGCVTTVSEQPRLDLTPLLGAQAVAIPLRGAAASASGRAVDAYYASIVQQLQDAVLEREPELVEALLAAHDRDVAPDWAKAQMREFRRVVRGLRFELHAAANAQLAIFGAPPPLGARVPMRLSLRSAGEPGITVPGADGTRPATRVAVEVVVRDDDCHGGGSRREFGEILELPRTVDFDAGDALELDFALPELVPEGCHRKVTVTCDLLPGTVLVDGQLLPSRSVRLASRTFELFPQGIESLRENPYAHLRNALELADPQHFDNVFLAARLMKPDFREDAIAKLIEHLRVGHPAVARVCTAALRELTGERIAVGDRDGWLRWWQGRLGR